MEIIKNRVNNKLNDLNYVESKINVNHVKGIKHLKTGKSDGDEGLMSHHLINAPHSLSVLFITIVFNAMLVHCMSPESMIVGTMIPIPKAKRQVICSSEKFTAITLK